MAVKFFLGFDLHTQFTSLNYTDLSAGQTPASAWGKLAKPKCLYHNKGFPTLDQTIHSVASPTSANLAQFCGTGGSSVNGTAYGAISSASVGAGSYTGATTITRSTWAGGQGHQLCIVKADAVPALTANEYWFTFDLYTPHLITASLSSSYEATTSWKQVFRWGDVSINCKSCVYDGTSRHTMLFSIRNNGTEVATCSVGSLDCDVNVDVASCAKLIHCRLHVKLDSSTGLIDFTGNGAAQSATYTNQNTVASISAASATEIYFGPPVLDDGSTAYVGLIDSFLIDDAEFPAGRPIVRLVPSYSAAASSTDAENSNGGTLHSTLTSTTDNAQFRFTSPSGNAVFPLGAITTTGFHSTFLGMTGVMCLCSNRSGLSARKMTAALDIAGTQSKQSNLLNPAIWPFSQIATPPETNGIHVPFSIFEKTDNSKYTITEFGTARLRLNFLN